MANTIIDKMKNDISDGLISIINKSFSIFMINRLFTTSDEHASTYISACLQRKSNDEGTKNRYFVLNLKTGCKMKLSRSQEDATKWIIQLCQENDKDVMRGNVVNKFLDRLKK